MQTPAPENQTAREFVQSQLALKGWASPAQIMSAAKSVGKSWHIRAVMFALQSLVDSGEALKLGRGAYATPGAAMDENLRSAVRLFILQETSPRWIEVPSVKNRGEWEPYEQWRAHSPHSVAKRWAQLRDFALPQPLFESEMKNLIEQGLLKAADVGPNSTGYYWATAKGRKIVAMFD